MKTRAVFFATCFVALSPPLVRASDRVAFVIGVDVYEKLPPEAQLKVAVSDAERMAATLESLDPTFQVTLLKDVSWKTAQDSYDAFLDRAKKAECALVYFAGHGVEYHGENFLLVKDTDVSDISSDVERMKRRLSTAALSLQGWVDSLDGTKAQVKLVILDCCRNNPLKAADGSGSRAVVGSRGGLAQVTPPSGTLISYSADAGQQANDGLFTEVLTKHLRTPGMPILKVFAQTREEVLATSEQWAAEDEARGILPESRRVRHEPAEYSKLNVAGTDFTFSHGGPPAMKGQAALAQPIEGSRAGEERTFGGIPMVWCPPGDFLMGSPESEEHRGESERLHPVKLTRGFWMAKTETTQGQWEMVAGASPGKFQGRDLPVETVSWDDAREWLAKMNDHHTPQQEWKWALPTEAQWEYACRAGTDTSHAGDLEAMAWHSGNSGSQSHPVGLKQANAWGLHDMHGNVWEWCADGFGDYPDGPATDPAGPDESSLRVGRGGSWHDLPGGYRSAARGGTPPGTKGSRIGFRAVLVPPAE